jgi:phosphatidylserine/phosphatidylglycerophosphate/cardiolipin synthase-like enzyme
LTSPIFCEALGARLKEEDGPDIIIVLPEKNSGWLEEITMGVLRARMLKRLRGADRFRHLRLYYPQVPGLGSDFIRVHAKVLVVDDRLVRVGSSNLNNRSMGLDTECDLAIESGGEARIEKVIAQFRNRLLGEHLGVAPQQVASVIDRKKSLALALDSLCGNVTRSIFPDEHEAGAAEEPWETIR